MAKSEQPMLPGFEDWERGERRVQMETDPVPGILRTTIRYPSGLTKVIVRKYNRKAGAGSSGVDNTHEPT